MIQSVGSCLQEIINLLPQRVITLPGIKIMVGAYSSRLVYRTLKLARKFRSQGYELREVIVES